MRTSNKNPGFSILRRSYGGALIEFLISLPLLIVFLNGIVSSGRLLNQLAVTGQAAFLGGLFVSQANNMSEINAIPLRVQRILCLQSRQFTNLDCSPGATAAPLVAITPDSGPDPQAVELSITGDFSFLLAPIDIQLEVTAPVLLLAPDITALGLNVPANPSTPYGCESGQSGASCDCARHVTNPGTYCTG